MKVLWFVNTPSLAAELLKTNTNVGGWIASLEKMMSNSSEVKLAVAFPFGNEPMESFTNNGVQYFPFPIQKEKGKINGFIDRWLHKIESDSDVILYMNIVNEFRPEIIHIFGSERAYGQIISHLKLPVVIQIQGNLTVYSLKWYSGLSEISVFKHLNIKNTVLGYDIWHEFFCFKKRAQREQKLLHDCKYIIGRTDWDRRITNILAPKSKYFHCDEILRNSFYQNEWKRPEKDMLQFCSILRASAYKGIETILHTASLLKGRIDGDFQWRIVGVTGREGLIKVIEKTLKLSFSDYNIVFEGSKKETEVVQILLNSNIFIQPSHIENSPNSVCESMLMGVPTIATYAGGTPSIIENNMEGILVQDGDPYAMAGAIIEMIDNPKKCDTFSTNSKLKAKARHNPEEILTKTIAIYKAIIEE